MSHNRQSGERHTSVALTVLMDVEVMQEIHDATELLYDPVLISLTMVFVQASIFVVVSLPASCSGISVSHTTRGSKGLSTFRCRAVSHVL